MEEDGMKIIPKLEYAPGLQGDFFMPGGQAPDGGFPAALLIHGGGWTAMDRHAVRGIADFLAENGFAVFNIDYRLAPQHRWPAGLDDCKAAARWLIGSSYPIDTGKIFIVGGSAGGHYALMTGLTLPRGTICGIVSISGIDDVFVDSEFAPRRYGYLLGKSPERNDLLGLNPAEYHTADAPPILCTHWRKDQVVPFSECAAFEQVVVKNGGRICVYSYEYDRHCEGHDIWIPGSSPHRLYPDLEAVIAGFMKAVIAK